MKKVLISVLILMMTVCLFGCYKSRLNDDNKIEYIEMMNMISDKYGEYADVDVGEFERQVSIELMIKEDYLTDAEKNKDIPTYEIIEDVRVMINEYLEENQNCRLAKQLENKTGLLLLEIVKGYQGSSQGIVLFEVKTDYRDTIKKFNRYNMINVERLNDMSSAVFEEPDYNGYIEDMYDYISLTGEDITSIVILEKKGLEDSEQEKWREEVRSKFPLMAATSE